MPNLRILYNNIADLASTISVATAASASMDWDKLLTEIKTEVFRSTTTTPTITYNWGSDQSINCIILPCTNFTKDALIRIKLYDVSNVLLYDTTSIAAVKSTNIYSGSLVYNSNLFSYGFVSKTAIWLPSTIDLIRKMEIIISDTTNTAGYIECSRVLSGVYWEPSFNVENGVQLNIVDESITSRTNAGNSVSDRGYIYDKISFNYALLPETDKIILANIIRNVGSHKNFFISTFPDTTSGNEEHDFMIYGKRTNSPLTYRMFGFYSHSMELTSW